MDPFPNGRKLALLSPLLMSPPPQVQHPNIIAKACFYTIRVIHRMSSLLISQARFVLPLFVDDVVASSSSVSLSHVCVPHTCITCKNICLGPIGNLPEYKFVFDVDTPDVRVEAIDPNAREEGHAEACTRFVLVRVYIFLL